MYIEIVPNRNSRPTLLLREGWREGKKVCKRTLANLTDWPAPKVEALRRVLKDEPLISADEAFSIERSWPHGHVEAVVETMRRMGLDKLIGAKRTRERDLVLAMIVERLIAPCSKLATTRLWHSTTLAQWLAVGDADEEELYAAMDGLLKRQSRIEKRLAARHLDEGHQVLYEVSSSYYEGHPCPLTYFGHSRDGKQGKPIVVYGVLTDIQGRPVAVEVYPGNTGDPSTVADQVKTLKERFGLKRVVLVGDRGMLTQRQIEVLKTHPGMGWISALRRQKVRQLADEKPLPLFEERNLAEICSADFPDERLIACFNPLLAEQRRRQRDELLKATERLLTKIRSQVQRQTKTPLSAAQIGQKVGKVINRPKMGKHFEVSIADGHFHFTRRTEAIEREAELDGVYVIRTSEPQQDTCRQRLSCTATRTWPRWSGPFARLKAWICASVRLTTEARSACVPTSFFVYWLFMLSGTCVRRFRPCYSTTKPCPAIGHGVTPSPRPNRLHRRERKRLTGKPKTGCPSIASRHSWRSWGPGAAIVVDSNPIPKAPLFSRIRCQPHFRPALSS